MKISYKDDYALKVMLDLARHYPGELVRIKELSQRQDIPRKFLEQILIELKNGAFVKSKRGAKGGYCLSRSPSRIYVGEVIRHVGGGVYPIACVEPGVHHDCDFKPRCVFAPIWRKIGDQVADIIDNISFASLVERDATLNTSYANDFQI